MKFERQEDLDSYLEPDGDHRIWKGPAILAWNGRSTTPRRVIWELAGNEVLQGRHLVPQCGHRGCVELDHLGWARKSQPYVKTGLPRGVPPGTGIKLDLPQVESIRTAWENREYPDRVIQALRDHWDLNGFRPTDVSQRKLAKLAGVSHETVSLIIKRETWDV